MPKKITLKRIPEEENDRVLRWYESDDGDAIVSFVIGDNPKNIEIRASVGFNGIREHKSETGLGSRDALKYRSESQIKASAERMVNGLVR